MKKALNKIAHSKSIKSWSNLTAFIFLENSGFDVDVPNKITTIT